MNAEGIVAMLTALFDINCNMSTRKKTIYYAFQLFYWETDRWTRDQKNKQWISIYVKARL